jgi:hypothetical protein
VVFFLKGYSVEYLPISGLPDFSIYEVESRSVTKIRLGTSEFTAAGWSGSFYHEGQVLSKKAYTFSLLPLFRALA